MNKKGFTLLELLATILILSLLMLVAVPNVMSTIDKNKRSTYVEDAKKMITLAEYKVRSNASIELPDSGRCIVVPLKVLDLTDFNEGPEGGNYDLNKSYVVIARSGSKYSYYATITEKYDNETRGLPLISREDLNKNTATSKVVGGSSLNVAAPTIGARLLGFTVSNIIDS